MIDSNLAALFHQARAWGNHAARALEIARRRHTQGEKSYCTSPWAKAYPAVSWQPGEPGLAHISDPRAAGLRHVGNVEAEARRGDYWSNRDSCGWLTDPHGDVFKDGTGLVWGVVYQLPARGGRVRFVPGYQFGGVDGGPTLDFGSIQSEPAREWVTPKGWNPYWAWNESPRDSDAAKAAARIADSMAQSAAEKERDYQAARQAGNAYAEALETAATARGELKALLVERRAAKTRHGAAMGLPALCRAIDSTARGLVADIAREKAKAAALLSGDDWNQWEPANRDAFCDASGLSQADYIART